MEGDEAPAGYVVEPLSGDLRDLCACVLLLAGFPPLDVRARLGLSAAELAAARVAIRRSA